LKWLLASLLKYIIIAILMKSLFTPVAFPLLANVLQSKLEFLNVDLVVLARELGCEGFVLTRFCPNLLNRVHSLHGLLECDTIAVVLLPD